MAMTNTEILQKAIEKAVGNGWEDGEMYSISATGQYYIKIISGSNECNKIIFSHSFAKAFWGEDQITTADLSRSNNKKFIGSMALGISWKYHLQQMVIEDDPIQYLEKFL